MELYKKKINFFIINFILFQNDYKIFVLFLRITRLVKVVGVVLTLGKGLEVFFFSTFCWGKRGGDHSPCKIEMHVGAFDTKLDLSFPSSFHPL